MGDKTSQNLMAHCHSYYEPHLPKHLPPNGQCKSEFSVRSPRHRKFAKRENVVKNLKFLEEYYKKYDHDEVPVKDSNLTIDADVGDKPSLTNSDLDKLEFKVLNNMSQEITTDNISSISLESNIKFFKTTVQEIFDNFYACMRDFEIYKKRFHEILGKNEIDAVADMEEFIKDMIQHIMSSDTSLNEGKTSETSKKTFSIESDGNLIDADEEESNVSEEKEVSGSHTEEKEKTEVEACIENEYIDATDNENKRTIQKPDEVFNIFLVGGYPSLQINMNGRNLLSELNIKERTSNVVSNYVASAENMLKVAAKKMEVANYQEQREQRCGDCPDRDIPVKISSAKKNIYLNEDFSQERDCDRSILGRICNFLCRKFRKL